MGFLNDFKSYNGSSLNNDTKDSIIDIINKQKEEELKKEKEEEISSINNDNIPDEINSFLKEVSTLTNTIEKRKQEENIIEKAQDINAVSTNVQKTDVTDDLYEEIQNELNREHITNVPQDLEKYLISNLRENIAEADLLIKNMLLNIYEKNSITLPAVRTITEVITAKNETLKAISDFLIAKKKLESLGVMDNMNSTLVLDDIKINKNSNQTLNVFIEKILLNANKNISLGSNIDDTLLEKAQNILGQDGRIKEHNENNEPNVFNELVEKQKID